MLANSSSYPASQITPSFHETISQDINTYGWSVIDNYLPLSHVNALHLESDELFNKGNFRPAGIGNGDILSQQRNDVIVWLDPSNCLPGQLDFFQHMEKLRYFLNRENYLGLFDFELHASIYKTGSFYKKHLDSHHNSQARLLTIVFYLNNHWQQGDGGELLLYLKNKTVTIEPLGGRLVVFLSQNFYHEVLPTNRDRYSLTGWFRQNALPL